MVNNNCFCISGRLEKWILSTLRVKIKGAVQYCRAKKLVKACMYEKVGKFLVQTLDRVEYLVLNLYVIVLFFCFHVSCRF